MPSASAYRQRKHKRIEGLVQSVRATTCVNCTSIAPREQVFKGWCVSCLVEWGRTSDRHIIAAAAAEYAERGVPKSPPSAGAYDRLKNRIMERMPDEWFIPLTLYVGNYTIGRAQAMWNFVQAMYELELETQAQAFKLGKDSHDAIHLCGLHAPVQGGTLGSFLGRLVNTPEVWSTIDARIRNYIRGFAEDNRSVRNWMGPRRRISAVTTGPNHKCRRPFRMKATVSRQSKKAWTAKWGAKPKAVPAFWPFAVRHAPDEHDMLHEIDRLTAGIPEQWRQDVCQDLVVAVLSGEASVGNIEDAISEHVRRIFKLHPIKYGALSLDAPMPWANDVDERTLGQMIAESEITDDWSEHEESIHAQELEESDAHAWHEGRNRPKGVASVGEILRDKQGGIAIPGFTPQAPEQIDEEIDAVYRADKRPRGVHVRDGSRLVVR